jgi:molecular chaperone GrpE
MPKEYPSRHETPADEGREATAPPRDPGSAAPPAESSGGSEAGSRAGGGSARSQGLTDPADETRTQWDGAGAEVADGGSQDTMAPSDEEARQLLDELEALRAQVAEEREAALRAQAELENVRKRAEREVEKARRYGLQPLMAELLPVLDSLELGVAAAAREGAEVGQVREGVELTLRNLRKATAQFGLEAVDPTPGQALDADYHEAVSVVEAGDTEPGTVVQVLQKGYVLHDRLVRAAKVIVAR